MSVAVYVKSESTRKRLFRRDDLTRLAGRVLQGEGLAGAIEVSVLFCDDAAMQLLNKQYRGENRPTDVLSFEMENATGPAPRVLGDIVISLETVEQRSPGKPAAMRDEVRLLFCHGLLHLLGHDHQNAQQREAMTQLQARYLGRPLESAWFAMDHPTPKKR